TRSRSCSGTPDPRRRHAWEPEMTTVTTRTGAATPSLKDFYDVDALYSAEERMIRDSVRDYVRSELLEHVGDWWLEGVFPEDLPRRFGEIGALGASLPARSGGAEGRPRADGAARRGGED